MWSKCFKRTQGTAKLTYSLNVDTNMIALTIFLPYFVKREMFKMSNVRVGYTMRRAVRFVTVNLLMSASERFNVFQCKLSRARYENDLACMPTTILGNSIVILTVIQCCLRKQHLWLECQRKYCLARYENDLACMPTTILGNSIVILTVIQCCLSKQHLRLECQRKYSVSEVGI